MKARRPSIDSLIEAQGLATKRGDHDVRKLIAEMAAQRACIATFLVFLAARHPVPNEVLRFLHKDTKNILGRIRMIDGTEFNDDPELLRWSREEVDRIFDGITF